MEDEVEDFLAHYGVKGMKWGVRRERSSVGKPTSYRKQKKQLRNDRDRKIDGLVKKSAKADDVHSEMLTKLTKENRASGMSRRKAFDKALYDKRTRATENRLVKAEDNLYYGTKKANSEYKKSIKELKQSKKNWNNKTLGEKATSLIVLGPGGVATQHYIATHPNASRGEKAAAVMLGYAAPAIMKSRR